MNSKELFFSAMNGIPEKVPFDPLVMHLAAGLINVDYSGILCRDPKRLAEAQVKCTNFFGMSHVLAGTDAYREASAWGIAMNYEHHTPMPTNHFEWKDFDEIETPDLNESLRIQERMVTLREFRKRAPDKVIFGWIEAPFAEMCCLFGMMNVVKICRKEEWRAIYRKLLERIVPVQLEFAKMQIEEGADLIGAGDSAISQIGPRRYKDASLDVTRYLFTAIKKHVPVLYHTCGDNSGVDRNGNDMLKLIASTGCDILDIDFLVDLGVAKEKIGKGTCIRGNTSTTILGDRSEPPEKITSKIHETVQKGMPGGRFIYSAGCEWPWQPIDMAIRNMGIAKAICETKGKY
ncbi:MAG: uroporphyrinogen decarboxylase family protein [Promethearchaeota archaeon]